MNDLFLVGGVVDVLHPYVLNGVFICCGFALIGITLSILISSFKH